MTSDYHIALAATMLQTACTYSASMQGGREMSVVAGASCATSTPAGGSLSTQAWCISALTGTKWTTAISASAVQKESEVEMEFREEDESVLFDDKSDAWYE